jgi:hypothetical protein
MTYQNLTALYFENINLTFEKESLLQKWIRKTTLFRCIAGLEKKVTDQL